MKKTKNVKIKRKSNDYSVKKQIEYEKNIGLDKNPGNWTNRILVGIPTTGLVRMEWVASKYSQIIPTNWSTVEATHQLSTYVPLEYQLPDAENLMAKRVVEGNYEWFFSHEQDNVLPPNTYIKLNEYMMEGKVPIISGLYFTKSQPAEPIVYRGRGNSSFQDFKMGDKIWCLPPGTKILGDTVKKIEDIKKGDNVLTHTGQFKKVTKLHQHEYSGDMIRLSGRGLKDVLMTPNHAVLVLRNGKKEWVRSENLVTGDLVSFPRIKRGTQNTISVYDYAEKLIKGGNPLPKEIPLNEDIGYLVGLWLAEGHISKQRVDKNREVDIVAHGLCFSLGGKENYLAEDIQNITEKYWNITPSITKNGRENSQSVVVCNKQLGEVFLSLLGDKGALHKNIPEIFLTAPKEFLKGLVVGFWRGDGCFSPNGDRFRMTTSSIDLAYKLKIILSRLGFRSSVSTTLRAGNRIIKGRECYVNDSYELIVSAAHRGDFAKMIGVTTNIIKNVKSVYTKVDNENIWQRISNVTNEYYEGDVYNITVEEDNSYVTSSFSVHNCDGIPFGCTLIHGSIIRALWNESEEYMVGEEVTRKVFELPNYNANDGFDNQEKEGEDRFSYTRGTTDLNFCKRIMRDEIFKKAGWPKIQKKKYPFLVDTDIFIGHIDNSGRQYPLGGVPRKYMPIEGRKLRVIK